MIAPLFSLSMAGLVYAVLLPLVLLPLFALLCIPSLLTAGARPAAVGKAVYCYVLMAVGIVLMSVSGIPALYAVMEKLVTGQDRFTTEVYVSLLLLFAGGGLTFLWHETMGATVDEASRRVSGTIFWYLWKMVGYVLMLLALLSFFLTMLLARESFAGTWWIMPLLLFLYGTLLSWVTRSSTPVPQDFRTAPMAAASATAKPVTMAKPSAKAKNPSKKRA